MFTLFFRQLLLVKQVDDGLGGVLVSVDGIQTVDNQLQEDVHILLISDDKVDLSVLQLQCYTLPGVQWNILSLKFTGREGAIMFAHHPESRGDATIDDALDLFKVAGGTGELLLVVWVLA